MTDKQTKVVTIFGSSQVKIGDPEATEALEAGKLLAQAGFVVCNGGYGGVMECSARGAKEAGGETVGVTTREFKGSRPNRWIDQENVTNTWRERLFQLIDLGDGYLVFPGGTGTLVELSCVWEMTRKGLMPAKPIVIMGKTWEKIVRDLCSSTEVEKSDFIHFAGSVKKAVQVLRKEMLHTGNP